MDGVADQGRWRARAASGEGQENHPHSLTEQKSFTDGRIVAVGNKARRQPQKRADSPLRYTHGFSSAVVEAKAAYKSPGAGVQQVKVYATTLGLKFGEAFFWSIEATDESFTKGAVEIRCRPRVPYQGGATKPAVGGY